MGHPFAFQELAYDRCVDQIDRICLVPARIAADLVEGGRRRQLQVALVRSDEALCTLTLDCTNSPQSENSTSVGSVGLGQCDDEDVAFGDPLCVRNVARVLVGLAFDVCVLGVLGLSDEPDFPCVDVHGSCSSLGSVVMRGLLYSSTREKCG